MYFVFPFVVAKNISGDDLSVSADFYALNTNGTTAKRVSDSTDSIKDGQTFILYGQFKNSDIKEATGYSYKLSTKTAASCNYDAVNIDVSEGDNNSLCVTGTNYSAEDIGLVGIRAVFFKEGTPVAFDYVNIGDEAYTLHSGSSNTQSIGVLLDDYDDYILTYSIADDK